MSSWLLYCSVPPATEARDHHPATSGGAWRQGAGLGPRALHGLEQGILRSGPQFPMCPWTAPPGPSDPNTVIISRCSFWKQEDQARLARLGTRPKPTGGGRLIPTLPRQALLRWPQAGLTLPEDAQGWGSCGWCRGGGRSLGPRSPPQPGALSLTPEVSSRGAGGAREQPSPAPC